MSSERRHLTGPPSSGLDKLRKSEWQLSCLKVESSRVPLSVHSDYHYFTDFMSFSSKPPDISSFIQRKISALSRARNLLKYFQMFAKNYVQDGNLTLVLIKLLATAWH